MTIRELREITNLSRKEFAEYFNIPYRTIQDWELEQRTPPTYVAELIEYKIKKEKLNMKKLEILRNKEDGTLALAYKGIDLEDYNYITVEQFIEEVESADTWDEIEPEVYEKALSGVGLNYNSYTDPDKMWGDFLKTAEYNESGNEYGSVEYEGKLYILTQQAYRVDEETYEASAADEDGNRYQVTWEITNEAKKAIEEDNISFLQDESNMCDWNNPSMVERI